MNRRELKVAGIDIGSRTVKVVVLKNSQVLAQSIVTTADQTLVAAEKVMKQTLEMAKLSLEDLDSIVSTGTERKNIPFATKYKSNIACLAKGARWLFPSTRAVIDLGAETSTVIKLDEGGRLQDWVGQDKCASGTGIFFEAMAKLMKIPLEEMAKLCLKAEKEVEISATCAIFAEQEVISRIHEEPSTSINDIIAGLHASVAERIVSQCQRLNVDGDILLAGGVAKNIGLVKILAKKMKVPFRVPEEPQLVAALGAALAAEETLLQGTTATGGRKFFKPN